MFVIRFVPLNISNMLYAFPFAAHPPKCDVENKYISMLLYSKWAQKINKWKKIVFV